MRQRLRPLLHALPLLVLALALPNAQAAPSTAPAVKTAAPFSVRVVGAGPPMILIPGLSCPGSVWDATVAHYATRYQCHVLTLAGFAGEAPIPPPFLPAERDAILAYIAAQHLDHPILVGHSLGGFLAFAVAAAAPDRVGPIVAVDGVPFLPALEDRAATPSTSRAQAAALRDAFGSASAAEFARATRSFLAQLITSPKELDALAAASARSNPPAVAEAMYELMTTDLRGAVSAIRAPVLLLASDSGEPAAKIVATYEAEVATIPHHEVVLAAKARHFIMLDQPAFFFSTVDRFLAAAAAR